MRSSKDIRHILMLASMLLAVDVSGTAQSETPSFLANVLFASKTTYERSRKLFADFADHVDIVDSVNSDVDNKREGDSIANDRDTLYPENCVPEQLSLILRHGARHPSKGDTKRIAKFVEKLQEKDISEKFDKLKNWRNYFGMTNATMLSPTGAQENIGIASRYVKIFPEIFHTAITTDNFELISSTKERAISSAAAFSQGISEQFNLGTVDLTSDITHRDDLLRFYEHCARFKYGVDEPEKQALVEFNLFRNGPEMQEVARAVSKRISSSADPDMISTDELRTIWVLCAFENSLNHKNYTSPWCDVITLEESRVLEYVFDVKAYWVESHGYSINYEQSCPLLADVVNNMLELDRDESAPRLSLYFGHSETLNPLLALLGLFYDEQPLLASNYDFHKEKRKFRQSLMGGFASNLGLVRYKCKEGQQSSHPDWPSELDSSMIQLIFNEHRIPFPFTKDMAVSFHDFETQYYQPIHHCNFKELCDNDVEKPESHDEL